MEIQKYVYKLNSLDTRMSALNYMENLFSWDSLTLASEKGLSQRGTVIGNISDCLL